jgi:glyoxylase I family protein
MIRPLFVDHLVWRVRDLSQTEKFYAGFLGTPHERAADSIMYQVGDTRMFFSVRGHVAAYDKETIGLNHFALGVRTLEENRRPAGRGGNRS